MDQRLATLFAPGARRRTLQVLASAVAIGLICWYLGTNVWHAIVLGGVIATVGCIGLIGVVLDVGDLSWRGGGRDRLGSRNDVSQLSGSLRGTHGRVDNGAIWRLRQIARLRLARFGLDYRNAGDRQAIEQLIGSRAYAILAHGERRRPLLRSVLSCLDALDALNTLAPSEVPALVPRSRRRITIRPRHRTEERT